MRFLRAAVAISAAPRASLRTGHLQGQTILRADIEPGELLHLIQNQDGNVVGDYYQAPPSSEPLPGVIVCVNRDNDGKIIHIRASKVGENGVKPNVWYLLDETGEFVEAEG